MWMESRLRRPSNIRSRRSRWRTQPAEQPPPPRRPSTGQQPEWLPLGVWALAQEKNGDAYMFFQLSIDKNGVVTGAYQNVLSGEKSPISGQVDKKTQRVAWKIGSNNTVIETDCRI